MPFLIPNSGDTTGGNKYVALDQAEPDSLDFEILGNTGSGVLFGCVVSPDVTTVGATKTVDVAAGVVILRGVPYAVAHQPALGLGDGPSDTRYDLVVVRITALTGAAVILSISGINSSSNPVYPKSKAVDSINGLVDLTTDVVLAAVLRNGTVTPTAKHIVDKRVMISSSIPDQGTDPPDNTHGEGSGSLYFQTGVPVGATSSGVWVKTGTGTNPYIELGQNSPGFNVPIGVMVIWPSKKNVPLGWIEANGQLLPVGTYPQLFELYDYDWGGSEVTGLFGVPNQNHHFFRGAANTEEVGTSVGADSVIPPLPSHSHDLGGHTHSLAHIHGIDHAHDLGGHSHTFAHTHGIDHSHTASSSGAGSHTHTVDGVTGIESNTHYHYPYGGIGLPNGNSFIVETTAGYGPHAIDILYPGGGSSVSTVFNTSQELQDHTHTVSGATSPSGAHGHEITVNPSGGSTSSQSSSTTPPSSSIVSLTGSTSSQSTSTTSPSSAATGLTGSGGAISTVPASSYVRWIIRAS